MNEQVILESVSKIGITSTGQKLESQVDPRFGRCAYFVIIDSSGVSNAVANAARDLGNGAGIQAAKQVCDMNVDVVVTGNVGPNAFRVLSAAGIRVFVGGSGTVRDALEWYRDGSLCEASTPTAPGHHGMGGYGRGRRR